MVVEVEVVLLLDQLLVAHGDVRAMRLEFCFGAFRAWSGSASR